MDAETAITVDEAIKSRQSTRRFLDRPVTLVVREYCNLHGLWETRQEVTVA